jgi:hypothetical protein
MNWFLGRDSDYAAHMQQEELLRGIHFALTRRRVARVDINEPLHLFAFPPTRQISLNEYLERKKVVYAVVAFEVFRLNLYCFCENIETKEKRRFQVWRNGRKSSGLHFDSMSDLTKMATLL